MLQTDPILSFRVQEFSYLFRVKIKITVFMSDPEPFPDPVHSENLVRKFSFCTIFFYKKADAAHL